MLLKDSQSSREAPRLLVVCRYNVQGRLEAEHIALFLESEKDAYVIAEQFLRVSKTKQASHELNHCLISCLKMRKRKSIFRARCCFGELGISRASEDHVWNKGTSLIFPDAQI